MLQMVQIIGLSFIAATSVPITAAETGPANLEARGKVGLQVVIDPATGKIVNSPSHRQLERLAEGITLERRRSSWELREFPLSGGGRGVYLDGWADHSLAVAVTPDGEIRLLCSQSDTHGQGPTEDAAGSGGNVR